MKEAEKRKPTVPARKLTRREAEVLWLVVEGKTNKQIGHALKICEKTVEFHLRNIYAKLNVMCRTEAAIWAVRHPEVFDLGISPGPIHEHT